MSRMRFAALTTSSTIGDSGFTVDKTVNIVDAASSVIAIVALVLSVVALILARRFQRQDFLRQLIFDITAEHWRSVIAVSEGEDPATRQKYVGRTAKQLRAIGETKLAEDFERMVGLDAQTIDDKNALILTTDLVKLLKG
jgi:hypothetical protein